MRGVRDGVKDDIGILAVFFDQCDSIDRFIACYITRPGSRDYRTSSRAETRQAFRIKNLGSDSFEWSNDPRFVFCGDCATVVSKVDPFHTQTEKLANHPYFEQFVLQEGFEFLQRFHPHNRVMRELRKLRSEKKEYERKIKEHYQSAVYESYFSQMARLTKRVDPNSIFFRTYGTFSHTLLSLDEGLYFAPHLGKEYNIPPFYFTGILVAHERNLPPGTKEGESLLWRMAQHYRDRDHPVAARSAIDQLIQRYPNSKTVLNGATEKLLNALDMREDSVAPDFVVQTVDGDSLRLSDFRGKFVMLDFWGTWCAPCLNELPHLKKLSQSFSEELKVIGLAHDDPRSLEDFLKEQEHKIPYPNGISDPKIEKAYGIVSWPTTFLIAPNGKIIAKNLRGEKLVDLVAEKLAAHK